MALSSLTCLIAEDIVWGPVQDINSTRVMNSILDVESPQLVVLNGDLIAGEATYLENSTAYFDLIVAPLVERGIPWASTYGNHDSNFNLSRAALFGRENSYLLSLTQLISLPGDAGITNFYVPVYPSDSSSNTPALMLWFFDSRGGKKFQVPSSAEDAGIPEVVHDSAIAWFKETSVRIAANYDKIIPSLAFFHIPPSTMVELQSQGVDPSKEPGINDDVPVAAQEGDESFVSAILNTPGLLATFSGHDHGNDWCYKWTGEKVHEDGSKMGLFHCFGRHSGYGGYGDWVRGSRQILMKEDTLFEEIETWIRLEDGSISGSVMLNATYGKDSYPVVERRGSAVK